MRAFFIFMGSLLVFAGAGNNAFGSARRGVPVGQGGLDLSACSNHPSLYFRAADIGLIREKVQAEPAASLYRKLIEQADATLPLSHQPVEFQFGIDARNLATRVIDTAFAAYLTGRADYMQAAIRLLCSTADQYTPDDYYRFNQDLFVGNAAEAFSIGYDLVQPFLSPEQEALLRNEIEELGLYLYSASTTGKAGGTEVYHWIGEEREARYASNWNTVSHGNMGLCALVLGAHPEWIERANERILGYFKVSNDATGAPYEGAAYLGYGKQNAINYTVALERQLGVDLLATPEAAHLDQIGRWLVYSLYPWGSGLVPLNQSGDLVNQSDWYLYFCSRFDDRVGFWGWLRMLGDAGRYGGNGSYGAGKTPGHASRMMMSILWVDNQLAPLSPSVAGWPLSKRFERGQVAARSGWEDDGSLFTLTSGRGIGGSWNHADENSFTFYALGESFAVDTGVGHKTTDWHNTILIDGVGQDGVGGPSATQGAITAFEDRGNRVDVVGDAGTAYRKAGLSKAERHVVYDRNKASPRLLIADDYRKADGSTADFVWQMFTEPGNTIQLLPAESAAVITGKNGKARCKIICLEPKGAIWSTGSRDGFPLLQLHAASGQFRILLSTARVNEDFPDPGKTLKGIHSP